MLGVLDRISSCYKSYLWVQSPLPEKKEKSYLWWLEKVFLRKDSYLSIIGILIFEIKRDRSIRILYVAMFGASFNIYV